MLGYISKATTTQLGKFRHLSVERCLEEKRFLLHYLSLRFLVLKHRREPYYSFSQRKEMNKLHVICSLFSRHTICTNIESSVSNALSDYIAIYSHILSIDDLQHCVCVPFGRLP